MKTKPTKPLKGLAQRRFKREISWRVFHHNSRLKKLRLCLSLPQWAKTAWQVHQDKVETEQLWVKYQRDCKRL